MTGNIIGEEFKKYVFDQISQRQSNQFSGYNELRNGEQLQYLNNQNSWIKLASSVDILPYEGAARLRKILDEGKPVQEITTQTSPNQTFTTSTIVGGINFEEFKNELFSKQAILYNGLSSFNGEYEVRSGISQTGGLWDKTSAYGIGGTNYGLQPMPGIISVAIECLNRGSIRNAIIEIKAYNKLQFAIIELLYLRLGFSMMLEWGNDKYIDNDGNYVSNNLNPTFIEEEWFEPKVTSQLELLEKIEEYRTKWNGNYDGFFGKVVNFDWSFESDGSYNITLKLVTLGDVIEAIQANTPAKQSTAYYVKSIINNPDNNNFKGIEENSPIISAASKTTLGFHLFKHIGKEKLWNYPTLGGIDFIDLANSTFFKENLGEQTLYETVDGELLTQQEYNERVKATRGNVNIKGPKVIGSKIDNQYRYYITFGKLLEFIQNIIIPKVKIKDKPFSNQLEIDSDYKNILVSYHPNQISFDPRVCIFKYNLNNQGISFKNYKSIEWVNLLKEYLFFEDNVIAGQLSNLYLNYHFIFTCLESNTSNDGKISLFKFLQSLCNGINTTLGNINKIEPIIKDDYIITFIDQVIVPGAEKLTTSGEIEKTDIVDLELYSYNPSNNKSNFVKNFDFKTEITPELASMVSIGATAGGNTIENIDGTMFEKWSAGLKDRYSDQITLQPEDVSITDPDEEDILVDKAKTYFENNFKKKTNWWGKGYNLSIKHPELNISITREGVSGNRIDSTPNSKKGHKSDMKEEFIAKFKSAINSKKDLAKDIFEITNNTTKNYSIYLSRAFGGDVQYPYVNKEGNLVKTNLPFNERDANYLKYDSNFISQGIKTYKNYIDNLNNLLYTKSSPNNDNEKHKSPSNTIGFIPVNLSLSLQGISGIKIYNKLNINQSFLPYQYPETLKFIIKKVNHRIINNQWETNLETLSIPSTTAEDNAEYIIKYSGSLEDYDLDKNAGIKSPEDRGPQPLEEGQDEKFTITDARKLVYPPPETTVENILQDINITARLSFERFFEEIESKYKGYTIQINAIGRSIQKSEELQNENSKNASPGKSTHNYNSAVDMNVFLPTGEMLKKKGSRVAWINSGIPDIATKYGLRWGGIFADYEDAVHFDYDFDRDRAFEYAQANPEIDPKLIPLFPTYTA